MVYSVLVSRLGIPHGVYIYEKFLDEDGGGVAVCRVGPLKGLFD